MRKEVFIDHERRLEDSPGSLGRAIVFVSVLGGGGMMGGMGQMMSGSMMGGGLFGMLFALLFWVLVVALIAALVVWIVTQTQQRR
jgi:hypothetical protein